MYSLILHGKKLVQLRVSAKLVQNASAFSKSFSSAVAADSSPRDTRKELKFTVSYLTDSLGLTAKLAQSISKKVGFGKKGNPDSVLNLLRGYGFTDSQISTIITDYPQLLIADAEKSLGPKLKFLQSRGASSTELTKIVSKVPEILGKKGDKSISRYYDFVKEIIEADKGSIKLCQPLQVVGKLENKIRNISVLRELGVPRKKLFSLLLSKNPHVCGKERFEESLKKVVDMGFDPTTSKFLQALQVVYDLSDKTIQEKVHVYKSLGFDVDDVWGIFKTCPRFLTLSEKKILNFIETFLGLGLTRDEVAMMVKRYPPCLNLSAESIKKKSEFLVKKMNWSIKAVVSFPLVFGYSMEKRIVPRCNVIKALISKGRSELPPLTSVMTGTDQVFLDRYVRKHNDKELMAELMSIFTRDCGS